MDKLTIINDALIDTGNNQVNLNDGTEEYIAANNSFTRAVKYLTARHNWPFAKRNKLLIRAPSDQYESSLYPSNGFVIPNDCLHFVAAYYRPNETSGVPLTDYEVIGEILYCNYTAGVFGEYIFAPEDKNWHPLAAEILTRYVEVGCLRSLNEDMIEARNRELGIEELLLSIAPRIEQESPAKNMYKSKIAAARRTRRGGAGRR